MREFILTIPENLDTKEIKYILRNHFGFSSNLITSLKTGNGILLNGNKAYVTKTVSTGDILKLTLSDTPSLNIVPQNIPLEILYEDEDILAINKPTGIPTHPSVYHYTGTIANGIMYYFRDIPFTFRAPSRLDRDTSGVLIIAKNAYSAGIISKQIASGEYKKEYNAVCVGSPSKKAGTIDAPIKREAQGIIKRIIDKDGKKSVTYYEVLEEKNGLSLIKAVPKTGRTHQIRLHLSHIGVPIYADFLYGTDIEGERIRLHCKTVKFRHPLTNQDIEITASLPSDMNLSNIKRVST